MSESGRSSDALYPSGAKPAADVEEDGEGDPDRVRVNQALQALPPLDRACLLLRFSRDFEPEQVAAIMDLECTVVDSLAESARKRFHAAMRRLEHGPASGRAQRPDPPNPPDAPHPLDSLDSLGRDGGTSLPLPSPLSKWELSRD